MGTSTCSQQGGSTIFVKAASHRCNAGKVRWLTRRYLRLHCSTLAGSFAARREKRLSLFSCKHSWFPRQNFPRETITSIRPLPTESATHIASTNSAAARKQACKRFGLRLLLDTVKSFRLRLTLIGSAETEGNRRLTRGTSYSRTAIDSRAGTWRQKKMAPRANAISKLDFGHLWSTGDFRRQGGRSCRVARWLQLPVASSLLQPRQLQHGLGLPFLVHWSLAPLLRPVALPDDVQRESSLARPEGGRYDRTSRPYYCNWGTRVERASGACQEMSSERVANASFERTGDWSMRFTCRGRFQFATGATTMHTGRKG